MKAKRIPWSLCIPLFFLMLPILFTIPVSAGPPDTYGCPAEDAIRRNNGQHFWHFVDSADPTCTSDGYEIYTCAYCDQTVRETIPAYGHLWSDWWTTQEPTCTEDGMQMRSCGRCDMTDTKVIPALGHYYSEWRISQEPTCTEDGEEYALCYRCNNNITRPIPATGHSFGSWVTTREATCYQTGIEESTCYNCGATITDTIPRTAHSWSSWTTVKEAGDWEAGIRERTCYECGTEQQDEFYKDGTVFSGENSDNAKALQELLNEAGYDCGTPDGIVGPMTMAQINKATDDSGHSAEDIGWYGLFGFLKNKKDSKNAPPPTEIPAAPTNTPAPPSPEPPEEGSAVTPTPAPEAAPDVVSPEAGKPASDAVLLLEAEIINEETGETSGKLEESYHDGDLFHYTLTVSYQGPSPLNQVELHFSNPYVSGSYPDFYGVTALNPGDTYSTAELVETLSQEKTLEDGHYFRELYISGILADTGEPLTSNVVHLESIITESEISPSTPDALPEVILTMMQTSPVKSSYIVGETLSFKYILTNTSDKDVRVDCINRALSDSPDSEPKVLYVPEVSDLPANSQISGSLDFTLPAEEVDEGQITSFFTATYAAKGSGPSDSLPKRTNNIRFSLLISEPGPSEADSGEPVLALQMLQTTPLKEAYEDNEEISFDWMVENLGGKDCILSGLEYSTDPAAITEWNLGHTFSDEDQPTLKAYNGVFSDSGLKNLLNAETAEDGTVYLTFEATGYSYNDDGSIANYRSNPVPYAFKISDSYKEWVPDPDTSYESLKVIKNVLSIPADPKGYQLGEQIIYQITVINTVSPENWDPAMFSEIEVSDPLKGTNEDAIVDLLFNLGLGETRSVTFTYTVTQEDVDRGYIDNTACASWIDIGNGERQNSYSNTMHVLTTKDPEPVPQKLKLTKEETSVYTHTNGVGDGIYIENDTITYKITLENLTESESFLVNIADILAPGSDKTIAKAITIGPGETYPVNFSYVVTGYDCYVTGSVTNIAAAIAYDQSGNKIICLSNEVVSRTGFIPPDHMWELEVIKKETSTPENHSYYQKGEKIKYDIYVRNIGDLPVSNVTVVDSLAGIPDTPIGHITVLYPLEGIIFKYEHEVTDDDVDTGYVVNSASAVYYLNRYGLYIEKSKPVISKTGKEPPTIVTGGSTPVETLPKKESYVPCTRTLTGKGHGIAEYKLHNCTLHKPVAEKVDEMVRKAANKEEEKAAWDKAFDLWKKEIDAIYKDIYSAVPASDWYTQMTILEERELFYAWVDTYGDSLKLTYPDNPETVSMKLSEVLMNKCADMCYEVNTSPAERVDSFLSNYKKLKDAPDTDRSSRKILDPTVGDVRYEERLSTAHASVDDSVMELLRSAKTEKDFVNAWKKAQKLWQLELDAITSARYNQASKEDREIIAAERKSFDRWLSKRMNFLQLFYPATLIDEEVIAKTIMNHTID